MDERMMNPLSSSSRHHWTVFGTHERTRITVMSSGAGKSPEKDSGVISNRSNDWQHHRIRCSGTYSDSHRHQRRRPPHRIHHRAYFARLNTAYPSNTGSAAAGVIDTVAALLASVTG
jgi:hypothetical protein